MKAYVFGLLMLLVTTDAVAFNNPLEIRVKAVDEGGFFVLVDITNVTKNDVYLYRDSIPWLDNPNSFLMKAYSIQNDLKEMDGFGKISDTYGAEKIMPNQTLTGRIDVCRKFPSLSRSSVGSDIVFLWIFSPKFRGNNQSEPIAGAFILSHPVVCE